MHTHGGAEKLQVIGGDSTNSMTGWNGGALAHLERLMGHKCMWSICMLHTNELPLRRLITELDGPTNSRDGFTGDIGKLLKKVNGIPMKKLFPAVESGEPLIELPENVVKNMSTD